MNIVMVSASLLLTSAAWGAGPPRHVMGAAHKTTGQSASARSGEQVFATNCSRCHQAPMSLSPLIAGTTIMHMRVRARLSAEDERSLLKYLAP